MFDSSSFSSEGAFDLFDHENALVGRARQALGGTAEDPTGLRPLLAELVQALEQSSQEQRRLMRAGDRQQRQLRQVGEELRAKSQLLEEQARHLLVLNTELAHEVDARRTLEVELRVQATTDPLTGVYNRRRFMELANYEHAREQRSLAGLTLLALDIDHFKRVNDTQGHAAGDATLLRFAQTCTTCLGSMDTLGRLGGEEFAILLPATPRIGALVIAERLRTAVASCSMSGPEGPFHISVSIGLAERQPGESLEALMSRADAQLYEAKRGGRNRVEG